MADDPKEPTQEEAEKVFWEKFGSNLESRLDAWAEKREKAQAEKDKQNPPKDSPPDKGTGTSRTGGKRVTLGSLFADAVFGPKKDE